jgi:hypothetical protein
MAVLVKDQLGKELSDALGLKHVRMLDIHCEVNSLVTVTAEFYPEEDGVIQFPAILRKYKLQPITMADEITALEDSVRKYKIND